MSKRLFQIMAGCGVVLGLVALWVCLGEQPWIDTRAAASVPVEWTPDLKSPGLEGELPANGPFPQTLARPLFSSTRKPTEPRPPEPVVAPAPQPVGPVAQIQLPPPTGFVLKGIFINEERQLALLQTPTAPQGVWLATGAEIEGWKVSRIEKQGIAIEANGQVQKLTLYVDKQAN